MKVEDNGLIKTTKLRENEFLQPFLEYLEPTCVSIKPGDELIVYRTQDCIPVDEYGESPRPRRKLGENAISRILSSEEVKALPSKKREKLMGDWGLSCNDSEESAISSFVFTYEKKKKKGASQEDLEEFIHERGRYICRYVLTAETGLITPFDEHGHANLYLYENVHLEDIRDKEYDYKPINYPPDER